MAALVNICKVMALAAFTFMCAVIGITVLQVRTASLSLLSKTNMQATEWTKRADTTWNKLDTLIVNLNSTANNANKASTKELETLDTLNDQITDTLTNVNSTLIISAQAVSHIDTSTVGLLSSTNEQVKAVQPVLEQTTQAITSLNTLIANPDIPATISNAKATTAKLTDTVGNFDDMVIDTKGVWHKFLHPTWPRQVWGFVTGTGIKVAPFVVK